MSLAVSLFGPSDERSTVWLVRDKDDMGVTSSRADNRGPPSGWVFDYGSELRRVGSALLTFSTQEMATMRFVQIIGLVMVLGFSVVSFAADDPSITDNTRKDIQSAMKSHIDQNLVNGRYVIYDAIEGQLKKLKFDQVHEGIVKKADFYISCADFVDEKGKKYDLDLLVVADKGSFHVLETVVHSIDGNKRKYHLED